MGNRYTNINRFIIDKKVKEFSESINGNEIILDVGAGGGHYRGFRSEIEENGQQIYQYKPFHNR